MTTESSLQLRARRQRARTRATCWTVRHVVYGELWLLVSGTSTPTRSHDLSWSATRATASPGRGEWPAARPVHHVCRRPGPTAPPASPTTAATKAVQPQRHAKRRVNLHTQVHDVRRSASSSASDRDQRGRDRGAPARLIRRPGEVSYRPARGSAHPRLRLPRWGAHEEFALPPGRAARSSGKAAHFISAAACDVMRCWLRVTCLSRMVILHLRAARGQMIPATVFHF